MSSYSDGLLPVCLGEKEGYIDINNNLIIPFNFLRADPFKNGYAVVYVNYGDKFLSIINKKGEILSNNLPISLYEWRENGIIKGYAPDGFYFMNIKGEIIQPRTERWRATRGVTRHRGRSAPRQRVSISLRRREIA